MAFWLRFFLACLGALAALASPSFAQAPARPNVVMIVIDDAGFSDLGAYGGEARTRTIDQLAQRGAMFTSYHTSPLCAPSRAMLLTGVDAHRTGLATIPEVLPPEHRGRPGYTMRLEPGIVTVASRLRDAGYRTYMTGKWHLGHGEGDLPNAHGFDRSFALDASGADNWAQKPYMPYYRTADWFEDGARATLPEDFYSSQFIVERMMQYLDADTAADAPFFAYLAFQAVHIPVQAPREFTARYEGVYDAGWGVLQERRWRRVQELGLIPQGAPMAAMHPRMRAWGALAPEEQQLYARSMAVHAGMLEAMDHQIGRFIAYLQARGLAENTVFIVTSDNGPEPSNPLAEAGFRQWMGLNGYTHRLEDLGERNSMAFIGPEWASATAAPGSLFKFYASEGGLRVPLIVAGPDIAPQTRVDGFSFVTDLTPTILDLAGVTGAPEGAIAITGRSLLPALTGQAARTHPPDAAVGVEVSGHAALFRGDFKLTRNMAPYGDGAWRLYNIALDPGETNDLSAAEPALRREMLAAYDAYAEEMGVLALPEGYDVHAQIRLNVRAKQREFFWWVPVLGALVLGGAGFGAWRLMRRRRDTGPAKGGSVVQNIVRGLIGLIGVLALLLALQFWINPPAPAARLGLEALNALGVATLRADIAGFFGAAGALALAAAIRNQARLLTAPLVMIAIALTGRVITAGLGGFTPDMAMPIVVEAALLALLTLGRRTLATE